MAMTLNLKTAADDAQFRMFILSRRVTSDLEKAAG
jgi:hypothetical protein